MNEKDVHALVKKTWPKALFERIENNVSVGAADCNAVIDNCEIWIEYKIIGRKSATAVLDIGHKVFLRPSQFAWHTKRAVHGSRTYVLAMNDARAILFVFAKSKKGFIVVADVEKKQLAQIHPHLVRDYTTYLCL
jgi:hypothetical protein